MGGSTMDDRMVGLVGGIAGSVIGEMGGLVGTYFSIKTTNGPRERAFMVRAAVLCWLGITAFLAGLFLMPRPWNMLLWAVYVPALMVFIQWANLGQARARAEEGAAGQA